VNYPRILGIGTANPPIRLTQEQSFHAAGYESERIRKIFANSDIEYRHFYFGATPNLQETSDQQNQRYLSGAIKTGCRAILNCVESAGISVKDVDFLAVCTCTGYVCPDVGSRLIAHMGFRRNVQRASVVGLGCAGAVPTLQRASDFVRANPGRKALMLAVEICSARLLVTPFAPTAPPPFCSGQVSKQAALLHSQCLGKSLIRRLLILRLSSIRSRSKRLDSNIEMASCELCLEHRSSISRVR